MKKTIKKLRHRLTHEGRRTWLTLAAAAPAAIVALVLLWFGDHTPKVQWTLTLVIAGFGLGFILSARELVMPADGGARRPAREGSEPRGLSGRRSGRAADADLPRRIRSLGRETKFVPRTRTPARAARADGPELDVA